jgi:hypothetical protein
MGNIPDRVSAPIIPTEHEPLDGKTYYWVGGIYRGAPLILGWEPTYERAEELGRKEMAGLPFEVYPLKYRGVDNATAVIKRQLLQKSDMNVVLNRVKRQGIDG